MTDYLVQDLKLETYEVNAILTSVKKNKKYLTEKTDSNHKPSQNTITTNLKPSIYPFLLEVLCFSSNYDKE